MKKKIFDDPLYQFLRIQIRNGSEFNGSMVRIQEGQHGLRKRNKMQKFQVLKESDVLNGDTLKLILELRKSFMKPQTFCNFEAKKLDFFGL
jgi:hypothetical protein